VWLAVAGGLLLLSTNLPAEAPTGSGSSPALDGGDRDRKGRRLALPNDETQLELETYEWCGKQLRRTSPQRELKE
jgi:hypothetical protein